MRGRHSLTHLRVRAFPKALSNALLLTVLMTFVGVKLGGDVVEGRGGRWRGRGPFERPSAPWVLADLLASAGGVDDVPDEDQLAQAEDESKGGHGQVVGRKTGLLEVGVGAARHAHHPKRVHGPEGRVVGREADEEVVEAEAFVHLSSRDLGEPVVHASKEREDGAADEHVVEVSDHEVGVVELDVKAGHGEEHPGNAAQGEGDQEAEGPERVRAHHQASLVQRHQPVEDLRTGWNRHKHGGDHEGSTPCGRHA